MIIDSSQRKGGVFESGELFGEKCYTICAIVQNIRQPFDLLNTLEHDHDALLSSDCVTLPVLAKDQPDICSRHQN